jgi:hypothetical protein
MKELQIRKINNEADLWSGRVKWRLRLHVITLKGETL